MNKIMIHTEREFKKLRAEADMNLIKPGDTVWQNEKLAIVNEYDVQRNELFLQSDVEMWQSRIEDVEPTYRTLEKLISRAKGN